MNNNLIENYYVIKHEQTRKQLFEAMNLVNDWLNNNMPTMQATAKETGLIKNGNDLSKKDKPLLDDIFRTFPEIESNNGTLSCSIQRNYFYAEDYKIGVRITVCINYMISNHKNECYYQDWDIQLYKHSRGSEFSPVYSYRLPVLATDYSEEKYLQDKIAYDDIQKKIQELTEQKSMIVSKYEKEIWR